MIAVAHDIGVFLMGFAVAWLIQLVRYGWHISDLRQQVIEMRIGKRLRVVPGQPIVVEDDKDEVG